MTGSGGAPPGAGGFSDLKDLVSDAIGSHGEATAAIFEKWGKSEKVDVVKESIDCLERFMSTTAKFILFWDNIASLLAVDDLPPINHPSPPVGGPGLIAMFTVEAPGAVSATAGSGLRRRGDPPSPPSVDPSQITVTSSPNGFAVAVDCDGVPRGLYEGSLDAVDAAGASKKILFNVYINPV